MKSPPTFAALCEAEPRLAALRDDLERAAREASKPFCANAVWYGYGGARSFRMELALLVGWDRAEHELLGSSAAYDAAYEALYGGLPDCQKGCACRTFFDACVGAE